MLSREDRRTLLELARGTAVAAARGDRLPELKDPSGALLAEGAAFVTLRSPDGDLRGCIGHIEAVEPLWESVREMAEAAASRDSRFNPVTPEEAARLKVEISVLSPMKPLRPEEIVVGRHGLYVRLGGLSGLLLPQVAEEWRWDAPEFLRRTCEKAGIPPGTPGIQLMGFTAEHFSSEDTR
jgi:AmmeMemoRadiSam system protein A